LQQWSQLQRTSSTMIDIHGICFYILLCIWLLALASEWRDQANHKSHGLILMFIMQSALHSENIGWIEAKILSHNLHDVLSYWSPRPLLGGYNNVQFEKESQSCRPKVSRDMLTTKYHCNLLASLKSNNCLSQNLLMMFYWVL
jgi:hypothetical protein